MVDIITKIMVEVLNVLGIATKAIRQRRMSKLLPYNCVAVDRAPFSEKYLKKLIGRTDIEDALKRLDRLTQEEAQMAAAQVLKVAHTVDDKVQGISDNVISVDNRVAGIDDRVADVGDKLKLVNEQVTGIDDRVKTVDDKIAAVMDGAQDIFNQSSGIYLNNDAHRWKRGQGCNATGS